jgi:PAS domain S-box-containing protein
VTNKEEVMIKGEPETGLTEMNTNEQIDLLKSIFESSTEYSIIALNLDGTILAWNAGASRAYGYSSTEIIGKNFTILHNLDDVKSGRIQTILDEIQQTGVWTGETQCLRKDGSQFNSLTTATVRKNASHISVGLIFISRDLTELQNALQLLKKLETSESLLQIKNKQLERATTLAEESNRLKSEFIANVSHELRTPLNGIIGFAEILYDGLVSSTSPKYKEFLNDIVSSAKQLVVFINDVLDLAKIEAEKMEFHPEKIDLAKLLDEIQDAFHQLITEKKIHLKINIDPDLDEIIIDPARLKQVFNNYISNAIKFTPVGGKVIVRVCLVTSKNFRLEVQDSGIGIPSEDINKLFVKFQQLDASSKKVYPGTGLGLALTKHIVEAQGGKVGVESSLGEGSTFYAILPCFPYNKALINQKEKNASLRNAKHAPTILVIEQESQDRTLMIDALIQTGYEVVTAPTIAKAIKQNLQYQFDAIILDLFQPDMGDWEIIRTLRSKISAQEAPPIVIKAVLEQPMSIGFKIHDFLIKPVKPKDLLAALEWLGMKAHDEKTILIIDNDKNALSVANNILVKFGFRVISRDNKISALLALEQESPDVVLLDPFMSGMDGFEFLRYYRQTERGLFTPVIIWTVAQLNAEERMHLKASVQRVVLKGEDLKRNILVGLGQYLPPPKVY